MNNDINNLIKSIYNKIQYPAHNIYNKTSLFAILLGKCCFDTYGFMLKSHLLAGGLFCFDDLNPSLNLFKEMENIFDIYF